MADVRCFPILLTALATLLAIPLLSGCNVTTEKHGDNKNVDIGTPFGSLHVKNDEGANARTGLSPYPGATPVSKHDGDNGSADVNMSFGSFKLGVHATELETPDPQDKVVAFYRKDMSHFGAVLTCHGATAVGQPVRTSEGLTCDSDRSHTDHDDQLELRAGSPQHQHIVGLHSEDGRTRIGLIALDLPGGQKDHDGDQRE